MIRNFPAPPLMHVGLAGVPSRTEDLLDFVVVGGGIAGLATAWSLQKVGHRVTVFEQRHAHVMAKCRESVRSTPTMTQILNDWGIGEKLSKISSPIDQISFVDGRTGEELGLIVLSSKVMETLPADFSCVQYGQLFTIFYDLVKDAGVDLHFNTKIVSVDPWKGIVTCEDSRQLSADIIVGADGNESIVRPVVLGSSIQLPYYGHQFTVNLAVPVDVARQDEELAALLDTKHWTGWFSDNCFLHGVLTGPGPNRDYSLSMTISIQNLDEVEVFPVSLESLRINIFEPRAQKLLRLADQLSMVVFTHYEPFDNWVHESGKVVLVGEAAHPFMPSGSHNTCACIEDAMTLSILFSLPATKLQTPMLLGVYEELRQPRCATVQRYIRRKLDVATIPHGPGKLKRDALLRNQRARQQDEPDDDFLDCNYMGFVQVFGFDAREAVQDWWVKLGRSILIRSPNTESEGVDEDDDLVDVPILMPVVVDAEVERKCPTYPIISDPLLGEDEEIVREAEAHRRGQR